MNNPPTREEIVETLRSQISPDALNWARKSEELLVTVLVAAYEIGRLEAEIRALRGKL